MASHFESIGIPLQNEQEYDEFLDRIYPQASVASLPAPDERYIVWSSGVGATLWIQQKANQGIVGMNPHFEGEGRVVARITALLEDDQRPFDGSIHAWALGEGDSDSPEDGCYPFLVDVPDFQRIKETVTSGQTVTLQVAAFAHELDVFASEAAYENSNNEGKPQFATRSFIPSGLFTPGGEESGPPQAHAIITGVVLKAQRRTVAETGASFYALLVETYGGTFDMVVAPEFGPILAGNVVQGQFWLSGRVTE
ncbi:MAG: hypothetical protein H8F28_08585 [Fibrella sp.]|nr:hypothetical protein [Armatimonadota bacterium]